MLNFTERFCIEVSPVPCVMTIFGASGDLAYRKLFPALYQLHTRHLLHEQTNIVGVGRTAFTDEAFRRKIREGIELFSSMEKCCNECFDRFMERIYYVQLDYALETEYERLSHKIENIEAQCSMGGNRLYYLALPSSIYLQVVKGLHAYQLTEYLGGEAPYRNVIIEKPFGVDYKTAQSLDQSLKTMLKESQIYRIDHYLGKETVQNIVMLRFANTLFEPLLNQQYVERVEIEALETLTIGDRAGYYDQSGCVRDMFQNHLLALLGFIAMDAPSSFTSEAIRDERVKVLKSIRPFTDCDIEKQWKRGQYQGYLEEKGVASQSQTETYAQGTFFIDNWRWIGVPFILRSGKAMKERVSRIKIYFKNIPHSIFNPLKPNDLEQNVLQINIQPQEGITLGLQMKKPGPKKCLGTLKIGYNYNDVFNEKTQEAYERLILDAMLGDQMLYLRSDSIEESWKLLDNVLQYWKEKQVELISYPQGSDIL